MLLSALCISKGKQRFLAWSRNHKCNNEELFVLIYNVKFLSPTLFFLLIASATVSRTICSHCEILHLLILRHPLSFVCLRSLDRRYRRVQRPVIDDSSVQDSTRASWFWLRLPAICMTFDPSPTRAALDSRTSFGRDYSTRPAAGTLSRLARRLYLFL